MSNTTNTTNAKTHGGVRKGAGRPPKALKYAAETDAIDRRIIDALPELVDAAIAKAKEGNVAALRFLFDRIFGRVRSVDPVSLDTALPYTEDDFQLALAQKQTNANPKSTPSSISIIDEINAHFRRHDRPTALDELAATLAPSRKEPNLIAITR